MTDWNDLGDAMRRQAQFTRHFFDPGELTDEQRSAHHREFSLSLHGEVASLCDAVGFRTHRGTDVGVDRRKILYEAVDVYRYTLAMLDLWGVDRRDFVEALRQKDDFLHMRHRLKQRHWKLGQPVVLFDLDDVVAEFRSSFYDFVKRTTGVTLDPDSKEYYNASDFKRHSLNNAAVFQDFIDSHGFRDVRVNEAYRDVMCSLSQRGCWIQLLTARPQGDLTAFYDTYTWVANNLGDVVSGLAFAPEKFSWLTGQPFHNRTRIFAFDDSPKHSAEYAKHGVPVIVPKKPYNTEVRGLAGISYVEDEDLAIEVALGILEGREKV